MMINKVLAGESFFGIETRRYTKEGSIIHVSISGAIHRNGDGNPMGSVVNLRDINEQKKLEKQLRQAQKMEALGILSGGIAHDFNNLLSIITGNIELAKDDIKPEFGISEFLDEAEEASLKSQEGQMKHSINNIIINSAESMPDGGTIIVKADNFTITTERDLPLPKGKYVKISIRDHGVGIREEHLSQIFDPYFSTKEMGTQKGMGLGLATTYSIINRHDGHITVESVVGVGTTFSIYLPANKK